MDVFESYHWPGNVRELENVVERIVAIEERETITRQSLPQDLLLPMEKGGADFRITPDFDLNDTLDGIAKTYINMALDHSKGNLKEAARHLRISYRSFRYMLDKYRINPGRARRN
jgi:DNA-binding NtrC family response regulator